jgi:hypothetical protein
MESEEAAEVFAGDISAGDDDLRDVRNALFLLTRSLRLSTTRRPTRSLLYCWRRHIVARSILLLIILRRLPA